MSYTPHRNRADRFAAGAKDDDVDEAQTTPSRNSTVYGVRADSSLLSRFFHAHSDSLTDGLQRQAGVGLRIVPD